MVENSIAGSTHTSYNSTHLCIDAYQYPDDIAKWAPCPNCGLKPKVWEFDNGKSTACGCGNTIYDHFTIRAESIMSVYNRTKSTLDYDVHALRKNWNHWCETGEILFERGVDGKW